MLPASEKVVTTPEELKTRCRRSPHIILTGILLSLNWGLSGSFLIIPAYISSAEEINLTNFTTIPDEFGSETPFHLITSAFSLGNVVFFSFYGWLSDRYGRRLSVVSSILGIGIGGILCAIAPNLKILLICRFIQGIFYSPSTLINWVHLSESTPKKSHGVWAFVFGLSWIIGTSLVAPLVMISPSWRILLLYLSFPNIFLGIFLFFYLQESLDYCVMNDDHKEVEDYVRRNLPAGCTVDMDALTRINTRAILEKKTPGERQYTWYSILRNRKLLFILFASCYMSFAYTLVHNAMSLTSTVIEFGNIHVNFVLSALVELPSYAVVPLLFHLTGEKETLCILHIMTSISGIAIYFVASGHWLYLSTWLFTKFASSSAFMCVLVFMSSMYPVEYRNSFVAVSATLANIAAVFAPQVYILESFVHGGMFLLFSLFTALAVVFTIFIPKSI